MLRYCTVTFELLKKLKNKNQLDATYYFLLYFF